MSREQDFVALMAAILVAGDNRSAYENGLGLDLARYAKQANELYATVHAIRAPLGVVSDYDYGRVCAALEIHEAVQARLDDLAREVSDFGPDIPSGGAWQDIALRMVDAISELRAALSQNAEVGVGASRPTGDPDS